MKELLDHVEENWKMIQVGPRNEILRGHAEQSKTYTIKYSCEFFSPCFVFRNVIKNV